MGWAEFAVAMAAFLLSHVIPVHTSIKLWLVSRIGQLGFTIAYSLLSLGVLGWLFVAAGRAPFVPMWSWVPWHNHVVLAGMLIVCLILALAIGRPNPFSFGGLRNDAFDPLRPGIVGCVRHPLFVALALWAAVHAFANGDLSHVLLFGTFCVFAIMGCRLIDRRRQREQGAQWQSQCAAVQRPGVSEVLLERPRRLIAATLLYAAQIVIHPLLFGVDPLAHLKMGNEPLP